MLHQNARLTVKKIVKEFRIEKKGGQDGYESKFKDLKISFSKMPAHLQENYEVNRYRAFSLMKLSSVTKMIKQFSQVLK